MSEYVCEMTDDYPDVPWGDDDYSGTVERHEEVVRCRDCAYAKPLRSKDTFGDEIVLGFMCVGPIQGAYSEGSDVYPDGFCAWGVRRES